MSGFGCREPERKKYKLLTFKIKTVVASSGMLTIYTNQIMFNIY